MSLTATWRPLPLRQPSNAPRLLASTRFTSNSYAIHITDLAHVWTETLDRRAIILRALKDDLAIDPSDGEENMTSFLRCIEAAFNPSHAMHRLTTVSLSRPDGPAADGLVMTVTCDLPQELSSEALTWRMYPRKQPPAATATELVLPLAASHLAQRERADALIEVIRQKDALVSKMLDKLEATGTALEHVFPALGTRKKVTREQAEGRVRGLAPFDQAAWEASSRAAASSGPEDVAALVGRVFGEGLEYTPDAGASRYAETLRDWFEDMTGGPRDDADERESTLGKNTAPPSSKGESQVARSSPAGTKRVGSTEADSETDDEGEAPVRRPVGRLGAIGGARSRPRPPPLTAPDDEETASESSDDASPVAPAGGIDEQTPPKKSESLALRDAPRSPAGSATASEDEMPSVRPSPAKRARGGLGRIGGIARPRREVSEDTGDAGGSDKGAEEEKEAPAKPVLKTLARPVKKKRKF